MAFSGDFGAAGNYIPFALLYSPVHGPATGYDGSGNLQFATPGGKTITPERLDDLQITAGGDILLPLVDDTNDGSADDTGLLVSGAPVVANAHSLPNNCGPGDGGWTTSGVSNRARLRCTLDGAINTVGLATDIGGPIVRLCGTVLALGQTEIVVKNMSPADLASAVIHLQVTHSIQA